MTNQYPSPDAVKNYRPLAEFVPAHWQSGAIESEDGPSIHYTRTGDTKPPILLLHGLQVDGLTWLRTAKALEPTYDVVMPDFRGHGKSGGVEDGFSSELLARDMIALIQALNLQKPFVVGHSLGAEVAGRVAAAHSLRAAVLLDPPLQSFPAMAAMNSDSPPPWMAVLFETMTALKTQSHAERMVTGLRLLLPGSPVWDEADYVSFVDGQAAFELGTFRPAMMMRPLFESPDIIAQIDCPVLLVTARSMMPGANREAGIAAYEQNWRDGQHVSFADSGHMIPFDQFDKFIETLTRFLSEH